MVTNQHTRQSSPSLPNSNMHPLPYNKHNKILLTTCLIQLKMCSPTSQRGQYRFSSQTEYSPQSRICSDTLFQFSYNPFLYSDIHGLYCKCNHHQPDPFQNRRGRGGGNKTSENVCICLIQQGRRQAGVPIAIQPPAKGRGGADFLLPFVFPCPQPAPRKITGTHLPGAPYLQS